MAVPYRRKNARKKKKREEKQMKMEREKKKIYRGKRFPPMTMLPKEKWKRLKKRKSEKKKENVIFIL